MTQAQRLNQLLDFVTEHGSVSNAEITEALSISEATARRYLSLLENRQLVTRTHGGATARGSRMDSAALGRSVAQSDAKARIARRTAALLDDSGTIALNGGTTCAEVARALIRRRRGNGLLTTVVTNSIDIAYEMAPIDDFQVMTTGGLVRAHSMEAAGPIAEQALLGLAADVAVIGVGGIEARFGISMGNELEAAAARLMMRSARRTIVVADSTKIGRTEFSRVCELEEVGTIVTDAPILRPLRSVLDDVGVRIEVAE
ncbi:DeoR/GlpR family DNA-binding transcription regulator [Microbacterium protaetiae]|nr:DeoR/GlpR family DNA-binding transcription regulator [Microbacterium protaetiae]